MDRCPKCNTKMDRVNTRREIDKVIEKRLMQRIEKAHKTRDFTHAEIPNAPLPDIRMSCPSCGLELAGGEGKCPRCGMKLAADESLVECPECGAHAVDGAKSCPKCHVKFTRDGEDDAATDEVTAPIAGRPVPPDAPEQGAGIVVKMAHATAPSSKGFVNGKGAVNGTGLVNGTGMVNGTGLVNGTGMINGTGKVNGSASTSRPGRGSHRGSSVLVKWKFMAVLIALVIIIPTFVYLSYYRDDGAYDVDGEFGEWEDASAYSVTFLADDPVTVIDEWSVAVDGAHVFLYVAAVGEIFPSTTVESLFLFIDSDGDPGTGYVAGGLGADFMIELDGWNDTIQSSSVEVYSSSGDDMYDWNSWDSMGSVASRLEGTQLEAMGDIGREPTADARFLLVSQDQLERRAASSCVPAEGGVLIVTQSLSTQAPLSGILPSEGAAPLLALTFTCDGVGGSVTSVDVLSEGLPAGVSEVEGFSLAKGEVRTLQVTADTSSVVAGGFVSAYVTEDGIESTFASVVVLGHSARAYVGSTPSEVEIDGAFGDWYGHTATDSDLVPVSNPDIDVVDVGVYNTSVSSSFYLSVEGGICSGSYVPVLRSKPVAGDGGAFIPTRKTAEDITYIFIDTDMSTATGMLVSVDSKVIGADRRIEVRGLAHEVVSATIQSYTGSSWTVMSEDVDVEIDSSRMEVGVLASAVEGAESIDFIIQTTDWSKSGDFVALDEATMLALTGGISLSAGTRGWAVDSSSTSSYATATSNQRKIFYDGTNFWSLYYSGTNTVYEYSADGGETWTTRGSVFSTSGILRATLWYDSPNNVVYVVGDGATKSHNVTVRKGTVTPSTATISWGNEKKIYISTYDSSYKNSSICLDSDGYVWVAATSNVHQTQVRYQIRINQTAAVGNVEGTWVDRGNLLTQQATVSDSKATLVPAKAGSGNVVWALYSFEGDVASKSYDGDSWTAEETIYAAGSSTLNTNWAPPSAVVDANGVVHVVYGTGHTDGGTWEGHVEYVYNQGSAWSAATTLDGAVTYGTRYPTISLDSSTGNVFAMWIRDTTQELLVTKNVSGTWSSVTVDQNSYAKNYLTSIYSAPGESYICMQWTQNTTSPYEVIFEKIPEFSDVVLPVFFVLTLFIAVYRRNSRREE